MPQKGSTGIHWELHGRGAPLFLAYTLTASPTPSDPSHSALAGYLERLTDRYCVLVMDYPNLGRSKPFPANEMTAERVCADVLAVADEAGFDRFAWWGFSWGGVVGLQLASRSDRVAALVCGGWPPLGGPYADLLKASRIMVTQFPADAPDVAQFVTFYESLRGWPEAESVAALTCPRMTYFGTADEVDLAGVRVPLAAIFQSRRQEIEQAGWHVAAIAGRDHSVWLDAATVVPVVRPFLDRSI